MENWYPTFCTKIESRVEENCVKDIQMEFVLSQFQMMALLKLETVHVLTIGLCVLELLIDML